jgi:epsin
MHLCTLIVSLKADAQLADVSSALSGPLQAAKNKAKYTGVSSSSMRYGGFGAGGSSGTTGSYSTSRDYASDSFGSSAMGTGSHGSSGAYGGSSGSSYIRSISGGAGAAAATATPDSNAATGSDPVEATRQRIARLKAEGALPTPDGDSPVGPGLEDGLSPKSKPKKLSEIKINPAISATFAKGGLAPPPHSGAKSSSTAAAASGIDLLGDLDGPAPAAAKAGGLDEWDGFASAPASQSGATAPAAAAATTGGDDWAAFDSAPPASTSSQVSGAGLGSVLLKLPCSLQGWGSIRIVICVVCLHPHVRHSVVPQQASCAQCKTRCCLLRLVLLQKQPVDINSLLGPLPTATAAPTTSGPASKGPLSLDDFCEAPAAAPVVAAVPAAAPAAPTAAGFDPFSGGSGWTSNSSAPAAAPPAAAGGHSDPFVASGAVHMMSQAPKQHAVSNGPKLGPETAKAKDPFADLAFI